MNENENETFINFNAGSMSAFSLPKYRCPVHGITEQVITSYIPGHTGHWCLICQVDTFESLGISKVTRVEDAPMISHDADSTSKGE